MITWDIRTGMVDGCEAVRMAGIDDPVNRFVMVSADEGQTDIVIGMATMHDIECPIVTETGTGTGKGIETMTWTFVAKRSIMSATAALTGIGNDGGMKEIGDETTAVNGRGAEVVKAIETGTSAGDDLLPWIRTVPSMAVIDTETTSG